MTGAHQPPATRTPHSRGSGFDSRPDDTRACDVSRDRVRTGCCGAPKATSQLLAAAKTKSGCDTESSASPTSAYRPTNDPAVSKRYSDAAQNSRRNRTTLKIRTFYNDFPDKDNLFFRDFQQPGGCDSQCTIHNYSALVMSTERSDGAVHPPSRPIPAVRSQRRTKQGCSPSPGVAAYCRRKAPNRPAVTLSGAAAESKGPENPKHPSLQNTTRPLRQTRNGKKTDDVRSTAE